MNPILKKLPGTVAAYEAVTGHKLSVKAVLFDMDGVLYDSMPLHARAWKLMCDGQGITAEETEFYGFEGMTGSATINRLFQRQFGHGADEETCRRLYSIKSGLFASFGMPHRIRGARAAVDECLAHGIKTVLVTGSAQNTTLQRLPAEYPGAFDLRITAHDVKHGKPDPEPYLRGLALAGVEPWEAVAIDNAPLGVESAHRAGILTLGVRTGPLPDGALTAAGADIELNSMLMCAKILSHLL
jgi:HAD hydrolase, family IA, variant 3